MFLDVLPWCSWHSVVCSGFDSIWWWCVSLPCIASAERALPGLAALHWQLPDVATALLLSLGSVRERV